VKYSSFNIKRYFPLVLLASILLSISSCRYIEQKLYFRKHSLKAAIEWARQDSARVADSLKRIKAENRITGKTLTDSLINIEGKNLPAGDTVPRYYIIVGSFTNHDNAKKIAGQYSGQGYKTTIISIKRRDVGSLELVSVKTFKELRKANIFLRDFQTKYDPDAWVYTQRLYRVIIF
jgi:hypothetical protein